jgi:hypothetical protein
MANKALACRLDLGGHLLSTGKPQRFQGPPAYQLLVAAVERLQKMILYLARGFGWQLFQFTQVNELAQGGGRRCAHFRITIRCQHPQECLDEVFVFIFPQDAYCGQADCRFAIVQSELGQGLKR